MVTITLIEGVAELKFDGTIYQPSILKAGGKEVRNPRTGEMTISQDKMEAHSKYYVDMKPAVKYVALCSAEDSFKDASVSLKEGCGTISYYIEKMTQNLESLP